MVALRLRPEPMVGPPGAPLEPRRLPGGLVAHRLAARPALGGHRGQRLPETGPRNAGVRRRLKGFGSFETTDVERFRVDFRAVSAAFGAAFGRFSRAERHGVAADRAGGRPAAPPPGLRDAWRRRHPQGGASERPRFWASAPENASKNHGKAVKTGEKRAKTLGFRGVSRRFGPRSGWSATSR